MDLSDSSAIVSAFDEHVFGRFSPDCVDLWLTSISSFELGSWGIGHNLQVAVGGEDPHVVDVLAVLPRAVDRPDVFVGFNFRGNHTITQNPHVRIAQDAAAPLFYDDATAAPVPRGADAHRWPLEMILSAGFGVVTACHLQLGPDDAKVKDHGLLPRLLKSGGNGGGIAMWAWFQRGLAKVMRDEGMVGDTIAFGHSRHGKAAIWATALDPALAGVISNNSGSMGAATVLTPGAETPEVLAEMRPYWFAERFSQTVSSGLIDELPQRSLIASILPRPVYIASAAEDVHADPAGERATAEWLEERYPASPIGYHCRPGGHDVTHVDWAHFLTFFGCRDGDLGVEND